MFNLVKVLREIALDKKAREYLKSNESLYNFLLPMAKRYIFDNLKEAIKKADGYIGKGYGISLEYMGGEDTVSEEKCNETVTKNLLLIEACRNLKKSPSICFDLSTIGLSISEELALRNLRDIVAKAYENNLEVILSMEESAKVDRIIKVYTKITQEFDNVGITLQAYLLRTFEDIISLKEYNSSTIRIVKGAYEEPPSISMPRSPQLNERYIKCLEMLADQGKNISVATHDSALLEQIIHNDMLNQANLHFEMLHGVCPEQLYLLKQKNFEPKIYIAFGREWHVHFLHRLAENPKNILLAIEDIQSSKEIEHKYL